MEQPYFFFSLMITFTGGFGLCWVWMLTGMRGEPP